MCVCVCVYVLVIVESVRVCRGQANPLGLRISNGGLSVCLMHFHVQCVEWRWHRCWVLVMRSGSAGRSRESVQKKSVQKLSGQSRTPHSNINVIITWSSILVEIYCKMQSSRDVQQHYTRGRRWDVKGWRSQTNLIVFSKKVYIQSLLAHCSDILSWQTL